MAANFWLSTHHNYWLLDKKKLEEAHVKDRELFSPSELHVLKIHFSDLIAQLGRILRLRQRVVATATVYFQRFYIRNNFVEFDPLLLMPTCMYLAAKVEECQTHAKVFEFGMKKLVPESPHTQASILECEFYLFQELDFHMIVFHPYRTLVQLISHLNLHDCLDVAWNIVNDSYRTDLALSHPPYIIALAAIYLSSFIRDRDLRQWFSELNVEMNELGKVISVMIELYELWPTVNLEEVKQLMHKLKQQQNALP